MTFLNKNRKNRKRKSKNQKRESNKVTLKCNNQKNLNHNNNHLQVIEKLIQLLIIPRTKAKSSKFEKDQNLKVDKLYQHKIDKRRF